MPHAKQPLLYSIAIMQRLFFLVLFTLPFASLEAQERFTISGSVKDAQTGEDLIGVNVVVKEQSAGTSTNAYGFYSLTLPAGKHKVEFHYIGYEPMVKQVELNENRRFNVELSEKTTTLQEVEVSSEPLDKNVSSIEMSVAKLDVKQIEKVPQLLGETDILRTLTLLPGVTTVGEGSSGFNVRGGNVDQNLILLDEAPVYNSSHLFGFFSIFNADAVKDVKLYKGGIPARYGGRLSSVVDVRQKEGNLKEFASTGGIGLLSSRLLLEAPIVKNKSSFMVAGRRSYADIFLALSNNEDINSTTIYFYDLNTKLNYKINENNRIFLSGYFGRDVLRLEDLFGFDWGNGTGSLRWNHIFNEKLFANFTGIYSDYNYSIGTPDDEEFAFDLSSRIRDIHFKGAFDYYANSDSKFSFGMEGIYYIFDPGKFTGFANIELQNEYSLEPSLYFSHEYDINTRWKLQYGLRYSSFYNLGSQDILEYRDPNYPLESEVIDTNRYGSGEIIAGFDGLEGLEPRLSVNYKIDETKSIKASYNRMRQYIHLISNTTSPTPVDIYRPAGEYIDPATVHQYALGYFQNFEQNLFEASLEVYYKDLLNLVDYRAGAELIFNEYIETELLPGRGRSYGLEFLLRKQRGDFTGWISYTLSRSEQRVTTDNPRDAVSQGNWYPANWDKTHDLSIVMNYSINKQWDIGTTFNYQTGRPISLPTGRIVIEDIVAPIYDQRNNGRVADYHRLDLSATYKFEKKPGDWLESSLNFGFYNLYSRRNTFSISFIDAQDSDQVNDIPASGTVAERLSLFGSLIPFVTWNFSF